MRRAFTLVEVIVAVMIIAVVIASLLQLFANNTRFFHSFEEKAVSPIYASLLLGVDETGFENRKIRLDELVAPFDVDDDLRRHLRSLAAKTLYTPVLELDSDDFRDAAEAMEDSMDEESEVLSQTVSDQVSLEIGRTTLLINSESVRLLRIRHQ